MKSATEQIGQPPQLLNTPTLAGRALATLVAVVTFTAAIVTVVLTMGWALVVVIPLVTLLTLTALALCVVVVLADTPRLDSETREVVTAEFLRQLEACEQQDENASIRESVGYVYDDEGSASSVLFFELTDGHFASELLFRLQAEEVEGRLPEAIQVIGGYAKPDEDVDLMTIGFIFAR